MSVLDNFEIVSVPRTFSIAEVKVLKNKLSFNVITAAELQYPPFVRLYISEDRTQLAIQPCTMDTPNAVKFFASDNSSKKRRAIAIGNQALARLIKESMDLDLNYTWIIPGVRFQDENVIIFDIKQAHKKEQRSASKIQIVPNKASEFHVIPRRFLGRLALPGPSVSPAYDTEVITF